MQLASFYIQDTKTQNKIEKNWGEFGPEEAGRKEDFWRHWLPHVAFGSFSSH